MSYITVEAELDHDRIVPVEPGVLPEKARVLVTVLPAPPETSPEPNGKLSPEEAEGRLQALHQLQQSMKLTPEKAAAWMATIRDARR